MRKNERAMVMTNSILHKLEDVGNHPSQYDPKREKLQRKAYDHLGTTKPSRY
jgi:hypothetical protein